MNHTEVHTSKPETFCTHLEVSACFVQSEGKLLMLQNNLNKQEPGTWGVPGGKLEKTESPRTAALRELFEETGLTPSQIHPLSTLYIRKAQVDFIFHMFKVACPTLLPVRLSKEHQNYLWASSQDLETLPLMSGAKQILHHYHSLQTP